jgi:hypothetical protein
MIFDSWPFTGHVGKFDVRTFWRVIATRPRHRRIPPAPGRSNCGQAFTVPDIDGDGGCFAGGFDAPSEDRRARDIDFAVCQEPADQQFVVRLRENDGCLIFCHVNFPLTANLARISSHGIIFSGLP